MRLQLENPLHHGFDFLKRTVFVKRKILRAQFQFNLVWGD